MQPEACPSLAPRLKPILVEAVEVGGFAVEAGAGAAVDGGVERRGWALQLGDDGAAPVVLDDDDGRELVGAAVLDVVGDGSADRRLGELGKQPAPGLLLTNRVASAAVAVIGKVVIPRGRALASDLAGEDPALRVSVQERDEHVDGAEGDAQAARGGYDPPDGGADGLLRVRLVAQLAEGVAAHHEHGEAKPCEAMTLLRKDGPGTVDPALPFLEGQFGPYEKEADAGDEDKVDVSEELKGVGQLREYHHQETGGGGCGEDEDVDRPESVEDHIAGALETCTALEVQHV